MQGGELPPDKRRVRGAADGGGPQLHWRPFARMACEDHEQGFVGAGSSELRFHIALFARLIKESTCRSLRSRGPGKGATSFDTGQETGSDGQRRKFRRYRRWVLHQR